MLQPNPGQAHTAPHLVGIETGKRHGNYVAARVARQGLDQRRLPRAGGAVQQKAELVRVPLDGILA